MQEIPNNKPCGFLHHAEPDAITVADSASSFAACPAHCRRASPFLLLHPRHHTVSPSARHEFPAGGWRNQIGV